MMNVFNRRLRATKGKGGNETTTTIGNMQESKYTDLQDDAGVSRDYTELQSRNEDYSDIDGAGHAYVNTQIKA